MLSDGPIRSPQQELAEVEHALSVLDGRHPDFAKAEREKAQAMARRRRQLDQAEAEARRTRRRRLAASLITRELIVLPVRHHSPACAWHVRKAIAEAQPSVVLVEGPRSFTELLPFLAHTEARMPLAIYTYAVQRGPEGEDDRRAAYYPFCDYSPELVAIREAAARQIPARFIDLDFAEQCQVEPASEDDESRSLLDERHFARSRYLHALAESLGCRDHEELWEHLFEVSSGTIPFEEHVARVTAYCHLARVECTDAELQADGTLQREAEMAWHIRAALASRPSAA